MDLSDFKRAVIEVELVSLEARKKSARNYCLNSAMQIEANLLQAQIDVLEEELKAVS